MLIVIVIIGILAAALVPRLQAVQGRARDTKRKADLRTIYNALEIYVLDNGKYPSIAWGYNAGNAVSSTSAQPWIPQISWLMTSIPVDPRNDGYPPRTQWSYWYAYFAPYDTPMNTYDLVTQLENTSDPDRCELKLYKYQADQYTFACQWGSHSRYLYDISPNVKNIP